MSIDKENNVETVSKKIEKNKNIVTDVDEILVNAIDEEMGWREIYSQIG